MSFNITSIEHAFAVGFSDVKKVLSYVDTHDAKFLNPAVEATVEGTTAAISVVLPGASGAVVIERAAFAALGLIAAAIHQANLAANANGLDIKLDVATIAEFEALLKNFKPLLAEFGYKF